MGRKTNHQYQYHLETSHSAAKRDYHAQPPQEEVEALHLRREPDGLTCRLWLGVMDLGLLNLQSMVQ